MPIKAIDVNACTGCANCYLVCPQDVIRPIPDSGGKAFIAYRGDCTACRLCEAYCPFNAITIKVGASYHMNEVFAMREYCRGLGIDIT